MIAPNRTEPTGSRPHESPGGDPASDQWSEVAPDRGSVVPGPSFRVRAGGPDGPAEPPWPGRSPDDPPVP